MSFKKLKLTELNRLKLSEFKQKEKTPIVVVLDNIRSMSNIGSVFRTSDAFAIEEIHLCGISSTPPNKEIHKTALGATDSIKWNYYKDTIASINHLKALGYTIISIEQAANSTMLNDFSCNGIEKAAIVFGNEVNGVQQEVINLSDHCIEIPQFGTKHSLNISVSVGIVLWDLYFKI